ncbi:MAG TPA: hypothetical protein VID29_07925 [Solirubrobacteraceae bacterium]|jgi:hypothetical protein
MGSLTLILASTFGAVFLATGFAIALGIVAARADERLDRQVREEWGEPLPGAVPGVTAPRALAAVPRGAVPRGAYLAQASSVARRQTSVRR